MENKEVVEGEGVVGRWERGVFYSFFSSTLLCFRGEGWHVLYHRMYLLLKIASIAGLFCLIVSFVLSLSTAFLATVNRILIKMCT